MVRLSLPRWKPVPNRCFASRTTVPPARKLNCMHTAPNYEAPSVCNTYRQIPQTEPHLRVFLHEHPPEHVSHRDYPVFGSSARNIFDKFSRHFSAHFFLTLTRAKTFKGYTPPSTFGFVIVCPYRDRSIIEISPHLDLETAMWLTTRTRMRGKKSISNLRPMAPLFPREANLRLLNR